MKVICHGRFDVLSAPPRRQDLPNDGRQKLHVVAAGRLPLGKYARSGTRSDAPVYATTRDL
ncbi:hypothetical protein VFPFJ_01768 [Purpureocillium lilacinum]|uniref:Uncharacterized protein n=1 Tax=Purpureocillium lilacinum TaxID=33203 RepID=A0A179HQI0_PURLI|nr:hypothetical protein VFPFJ_01768 [Purpureocillium lilacinum]OAQ92607.1 hypothetical protein VFPFJ_01768 [Purpureocillium lilacinum]